MPIRARTYHDCKQFCRSSSICGSFFAMIWCVNMLVSAVSSLSYVSEYFDEWIPAEAVIIGRNVTVYYWNSKSNSSSGSSQRRFLAGSNIPNFTDEDFLGMMYNESDLFGGDHTVTNNTQGNDGLGQNFESGNGLGNETDGQDSNANNTDVDDGDLNEDLVDTTNRPTHAPTSLPPVQQGGRLVYCAEVRFRIDENTTLTAVSDTYCSYDAEDIVVGRVFIILYNPEVPTEIIEETLFVHAQNTLRLTVGVTIFFTVGYLLCSIYLWRSQPDFTRGIFPHMGHDMDFHDGRAHENTQTPEEREALMRTKFHFQTVLEDLSNTNAASIRRLCLGEAEEEGECEQCNSEPCCCNNKKSKEDADKKIELHDDVEAQQQKGDPLQHQGDDEEDDLELDLTKKDSRDGSTTSNTENETDTDAGSNNQDSATSEMNNAKQPRPESQEQESAWSLAGATNLISSWMGPSAPECCICLETYQQGDRICLSKKNGCDHVFHQQCIEAWLHRHDACPLCRVDLMNSED